MDLSHLTVVGRVALAGSPEGLAADLGRHRLWVTLPGSNTLAEIDLSGHGGGVAATYPTVQQANSDAVDPQTGTVYVAGRTDAGTLQILTP